MEVDVEVSRTGLTDFSVAEGIRAKGVVET